MCVFERERWGKKNPVESEEILKNESEDLSGVTHEKRFQSIMRRLLNQISHDRQ